MNLLGQDHVLRALSIAWRNDRLAHAYVFVGPHGVGKERIARIFGAMLLSGETEPDRAAAHEAGRRVIDGTHPDVELKAPPPDKRVFPINTIKELNEWLNRKPFESAFKLAILRDVDQMNQEAANAFLKTLEEPPGNAVLMLLASDWNKLLPTIQSRAHAIRFRPLPSDTIPDALVALRDMDERARERAEAEAAAEAAAAAESKGGGTKTRRRVATKKVNGAAPIIDITDPSPFIALAQGSPGYVRELAADGFDALRALVIDGLNRGDPVGLAEQIAKETEKPGDVTAEPQRQRLARLAHLAAIWCRDAAARAAGAGDALRIDVDKRQPAFVGGSRVDPLALAEEGDQFCELAFMLERNVLSKLIADVLASRLYRLAQRWR